MPIRRRRRNYKKKKPYRKVARYRRKRYSTPLGGFPNSKMVKFRYIETITLDPATNAVAPYVFRANSIYDPDYSSGGHTPPNYVTWMTLYNHWTVLGSRISMSPCPNSTTATTQGIYGIMLSDAGNKVASQASINGLLEQGKVSYQRTPTGVQNAPSTSTRVVKNFSASKFFGRPKNVLINDGTYRGGTSSNPSEIAYFECFYASIAANNPGAMTFLVQIDYVAILNERSDDIEL